MPPTLGGRSWQNPKRVLSTLEARSSATIREATGVAKRMQKEAKRMPTGGKRKQQCLHFPYLGVYRNREDIQKRMNKLAQMGENKENGTSVGQGGTEEDPKIKRNKKTAPKNKREDEYVAFWNIFY